MSLDRWRLYAYVLMTNHYHLLIETPEATLSKGMHRLNGSYTQRYNRRHGRVGHLFQGRYTSILVERESHLLTLIRYVVLNPVRAGIVRRPAEWKWSSYRATAGIRSCPPWLHREWILKLFGGARGAARRYRLFVEDRAGSDDRPWQALEGQVFLGSDGFRLRAQDLVAGAHENSAIPRVQRRPARPALELIARAACAEFRESEGALRSRRQSDARLAFAVLARRDALEPASRYSSLLGIGASGASELAKRGEALLNVSPAFRLQVERIRATIRARISKSET